MRIKEQKQTLDTHTPFSPLPLIGVFAVSVFEHPAHEDESQSYFSSHLDFRCSSNNISRSHFQISARTTFRFPLSAMDFLSVRVKYSSLCSVFSPVISDRRSKINKNQKIWYITSILIDILQIFILKSNSRYVGILGLFYFNFNVLRSVVPMYIVMQILFLNHLIRDTRYWILLKHIVKGWRKYCWEKVVSIVSRNLSYSAPQWVIVNLLSRQYWRCTYCIFEKSSPAGA